MTNDDLEGFPDFDVLSDESTKSMREWCTHVWSRSYDLHVLRYAELPDTDSSEDYSPTRPVDWKVLIKTEKARWITLHTLMLSGRTESSNTSKPVFSTRTAILSSPLLLKFDDALGYCPGFTCLENVKEVETRSYSLVRSKTV